VPEPAAVAAAFPPRRPPTRAHATRLSFLPVSATCRCYSSRSPPTGNEPRAVSIARFSRRWTCNLFQRQSHQPPGFSVQSAAHGRFLSQARKCWAVRIVAAVATVQWEIRHAIRKHSRECCNRHHAVHSLPLGGHPQGVITVCIDKIILDAILLDLRTACQRQQMTVLDHVCYDRIPQSLAPDWENTTDVDS
jgi:hypothetical protein